MAWGKGEYDHRTMALPGGPMNMADRSRHTLARAAVVRVAIRFKGFRVEHLRHVGWQLFRAAACGRASYVCAGVGEMKAYWAKRKKAGKRAR